MAKSDPLATYNAKRDFAKTPEPAGERHDADTHIFMVQKHDATRLHYDLRLELEGTLKSWAVTRGPSLNPDDKRLAVRTEDHPMSYATFEGTIPKGEYGGGTVMLWDRGTWTPDPRKDPVKTLAEGHLHFTLHGERMKGEWIMIRLKPRGREKTENWLLRKVDDRHAGSSDGLVEHYLTSVSTGRTMSEIARGAAPKKKDKPRAKGPKKAAIPAFRAVQKATLVDGIPAGEGWLYEIKYDGYRCLLAIADGTARIYTRSGLDWTDKFPEIAAAAAEIEADSALLDGEIVALDENGLSRFSPLQQAISEGGRGLTLFLFDALQIDGEDLTKRGNEERKARLAELVGEGVGPFILYADHVKDEGAKLLKGVGAAGGEGVVAKRADAPYRGDRTKNWLKIKCVRRQEFIIIGWSKSDKTRGFRSLLLGTHEGGKLRYAGKVGTGFSTEVMNDLAERMAALTVDKAPAEVPRAEARGVTWVKPALVAEIAFAEFTGEGVVRHASFQGLREDKKPKDVVLETEVHVEPDPPPAKRTATKAKATPKAPADGVKITNAERVIFPDVDITKGDLADYYRAVGPAMMKWVGDRPVSLVRCPSGNVGKCFFQKHETGSFGPNVHHVPIREKDGSTEDYIYVDAVAGILACVQMGTIEFHGWGSCVGDVEKPNRLIFDLDPDEGLGFEAVRKAAFDLRTIFSDMGLASFPLLTGGKGVHVVIPLTPEAEWPRVKDFAQRFAQALAGAEPKRFTANLAKAKRKGRIFIDYLRNQRGSTAIMPYSVRARDGAPVSAPITWDELSDTESGGRYTVRDADELVKRAKSRVLRGWGEADQVLPPL